MSEFLSKGSGLIAIMGDEDTVAGFMLTGIGHRSKKSGSNFMIVDPEKTPKDKAIAFFKGLTERPDIALILVNQSIAEMIRSAIEAHTAPLPTVLEIPSKEHPYDESKDPIMIRVNKLLGSQEDRD
eukprot:TRINITY_DN84056_c0_g1_i1.p1 TRINITY_DN84056_c0_g1~~TRINITY_DN84056_c0_g1_i1.p1  ORF type:complete len:126 (+),score=21.56 TRINITY_DN84056_c0_g1_i1:20-397(+)